MSNMMLVMIMTMFVVSKTMVNKTQLHWKERMVAISWHYMYPRKKKKQFQEELGVTGSTEKSTRGRKKSGRKGKTPQKLSNKEHVMINEIVDVEGKCLANDDIYFSTLACAEAEAEQEKIQLQKAERQARIMQQKLQAEEHRKKRLQLEQQNVKTTCKVDQARKKYKRKFDKFLHSYKTKRGTKEVKQWLDTQVTRTSSNDDVDSDNEIVFRKNRPFLNIPKRNTEAYAIARELINDDNLSICRDTGIMK